MCGLTGFLLVGVLLSSMLPILSAGDSLLIFPNIFSTNFALFFDCLLLFFNPGDLAFLIFYQVLT